MPSWKFFPWLSDYVAKLPSRRRPRRPFSVRLQLECLEERLVPTSFIVMDNSDLVTDPMSLRYALANLAVGTAANTNTINFASNLSGQTITESTADGGTLAINQGVTITGPAGGITIDGSNANTVFSVASGITASLTGLTITNGNGLLSFGGGGIFNSGTLTVNVSTISNNSGNFGGGIENQGALTVNASTISGNSGTTGAGIDNNDTLTINDSTFSGNTAGVGGGVNNSGTLTLTDSTLSGNSAGAGSGVNNTGVVETLDGDVIVGNIFGNSTTNMADDLAGAAVDPASSDNVIGTDGTASLTNGVNGNQVNVTVAQADLAVLGNYGGPTQTFALLPGSVAIGMGQTGVAATDQRGAPRSAMARSDAGAFQDEGYTLTPINTPQSTAINTAFALPLTVALTENFVNSPLPGATINFAAPISGASAVLSSPTVTDANGQTSVTATANGTGGSYAVTASDAGTDTAMFQLTNTAPAVISSIVTTTGLSAGTAVGFEDSTFTVVINGSGFEQGATVMFGSATLTPTSITSTQITFVVPAAVSLAADEGVVNVAVINPAPTNAVPFPTFPIPAPPNTVPFTIEEALLPDATRGTADQRFLNEVYRDLFNREIDVSGLNSWGALLSAGVSRQQVVYEIERTTSKEYYTDEVQAAYQQFLHRAADSLGLGASVNFLAAGGTIEQVDAFIIGSPEYYQNRAGGTSAGFAAALYQDALGRPAEPDAAQSVEQFLAQGGTRLQAAANILTSIEYRTDLVQSYYLRLLDRPADPSGEQGFINALNSGLTDDVVISLIAGSKEYYAKTAD